MPTNETKPADDRAEYDEFEKLAKKLVDVPKKEIDAERAKVENGEKPKP